MWVRTRRLDTLLLVALTGAWSVCFALHASQLMRGGLAWIPVVFDTASSTDAHPAVRAFWPGAEDLAPDLVPGDRIESARGHDLAGARPLDLVTVLYAGPQDQPIDVVARRGDERFDASLRLQPIASGWRKTLVALGLAVMGSLAFWRTRGSSHGRAFYLAMMAYAFHWTDFWGGPAWVTTGAVASFGIATTLTAPLALRAFQAFPEEIVPPAGPARWWPWLFVIMGPAFTAWAFGLPRPVAHAQSIAAGINLIFIGALISLMTMNYRASGVRGRRQLTWVVVGFWVGLAPIFITSLVVLAAPELWWLYEASLVLALAIPICLFVALVRFNLFDVHRLMTAAMIYSVIGTVALAGFLLVVPTASALAEPLIDPAVSQPVLILGLGSATLLGLRRLDGLVQQKLHPERRALEEAAGRIRMSLSGCEKPADLLTTLGERLHQLLRVETVAIYARGDDAFAPVFARGSAICPSFDANGSLVGRLGTAQEALEPTRIRPEEAERAEWAALQSMGVELVLPISLRGDLAGFVCLGAKASGDVFTTPEIALLLGLADKVSDELLRFAQADVHRQTRELSEQLRRYVPAAVAREIDAGLTLDPGERDVTILFVDVRGYTPFSQGQRPDAIFAAVSQYTDLVSRIVDDCGGAVVEFHGDGLMAVFGAPRPLEAKEAAGLLAARTISEAVPKLDLRTAEGAAHSFDVGVGVATGSAYVGPLTTADRTIWVALGNTTNLAARLEAATRTLEVAVVTDDATRLAAGDEGVAFVAHPALRVKGRSAPIDVWTWSGDQEELAP